MLDVIAKTLLKNIAIGAVIAGVQIYFTPKRRPNSSNVTKSEPPVIDEADSVESASENDPLAQGSNESTAEPLPRLPTGHVILEPDSVELKVFDSVVTQSAQKADSKTGRRKSKRPPRLVTVNELDQLDELPQRERTSTARTRSRNQ